MLVFEILFTSNSLYHSRSMVFWSREHQQLVEGCCTQSILQQQLIAEHVKITAMASCVLDIVSDLCHVWNWWYHGLGSRKDWRILDLYYDDVKSSKHYSDEMTLIFFSWWDDIVPVVTMQRLIKVWRTSALDHQTSNWWFFHHIPVWFVYNKCHTIANLLPH